MIEKMTTYFEKEYTETKEIVDRIRNNESTLWQKKDIKEIVHNTICRCFGVTIFIQREFDFGYSEVNDIYEKYRKDLEALYRAE